MKGKCRIAVILFTMVKSPSLLGPLLRLLLSAMRQICRSPLHDFVRGYSSFLRLGSLSVSVVNRLHSTCRAIIVCLRHNWGELACMMVMMILFSWQLILLHY
jgi:hypothetical protein